MSFQGGGPNLATSGLTGRNVGAARCIGLPYRYRLEEHRAGNGGEFVCVAARDMDGNIVIPPKYDRAGNFEDGLASVESDGRSFYIDKTGREFKEWEYQRLKIQPLILSRTKSKLGHGIFLMHNFNNNLLTDGNIKNLSLIHIWRCRRSTLCRSRWSPYH